VIAIEPSPTANADTGSPIKNKTIAIFFMIEKYTISP
jgi:hypothetical protein